MRQCSIYYFKSLIRVSNKSRSTIKCSRFTCASCCYNCFFNFLAMFIELIRSTSISFSLDIELSCTWIKASSYSSIYFFEDEIFSILITFLIRLCEDDFAESLRLRAWLRVSRSQLNIVVNWAVSYKRNN